MNPNNETCAATLAFIEGFEPSAIKTVSSPVQWEELTPEEIIEAQWCDWADAQDNCCDFWEP